MLITHWLSHSLKQVGDLIAWQIFESREEIQCCKFLWRKSLATLMLPLNGKIWLKPKIPILVDTNFENKGYNETRLLGEFNFTWAHLFDEQCMLMVFLMMLKRNGRMKSGPLEKKTLPNFSSQRRSPISPSLVPPSRQFIDIDVLLVRSCQI